MRYGNSGVVRVLSSATLGGTVASRSAYLQVRIVCLAEPKTGLSFDLDPRE